MNNNNVKIIEPTLKTICIKQNKKIKCVIIFLRSLMKVGAYYEMNCLRI